MLYIIFMDISLFLSPFFFLLVSLLAVYFIFILDCINDVRQKASLSDFFFLFKFKMGHKAVETTWNINDTFGPGTANEHTVQGWFKKFCKGDESLEDEERSGQLLEADSWKLRAIIEADLLTTTWEMAEECSVNHSTIHLALKQIGKVKKLAKWVPHELTANQKNHHSEVFPYLILCNNQPFLGQVVMNDQKWYNQLWPAQCWDWEEAPNLFPKPKRYQRKVMVTVW